MAGSDRWSIQFGAVNDRRKGDVEQRRKGIEVAEACLWIRVMKLGRERNDSHSGRGAVKRDADSVSQPGFICLTELDGLGLGAGPTKKGERSAA